MPATNPEEGGLWAKLWGRLDQWWGELRNRTPYMQKKLLTDWIMPRLRDLTGDEAARVKTVVNESLKAQRAGDVLNRTQRPPIVPNIPVVSMREEPLEARYRVRVRVEYLDQNTGDRYTVIQFTYHDKPPTPNDIARAIQPYDGADIPGGSPPPPGWTPTRYKQGSIWVEGIDRAF